MMSQEMLDFGLVGISLIVIYKMIDVGKTMLLAKKINGYSSTDGRIPTMTPLACQIDPVHFTRIKDMDGKLDAVHSYTEANTDTMKDIRQGVASGGFECLWKDRDEVRDFIEGMRGLTVAVNELTKVVKRTSGGGI